MDPETEAGTAPPEEGGQGQQESQNSGLYPDLSSIPESLRGQVLPLLKEYEGNVTRKFQEAAEYRKTWEPFEQLGIQEVDPTELQELLEFRAIAQDPEKFQQWYQSIGEQLGFSEAQQQQYDQGQGAGQDLTTESVAQLIDSALQQRMAPIEQTYQTYVEQQALAEAETFINSKLDGLQTQHGEFDRDAVCQLALAYEGQDALDRGFADYQRLIGGAEKSALQAKVNQPSPPEGGGPAAVSGDRPRTFAEAKEAARQMMAQTLGT